MPKEICMLAHLYDPKRVIFPAYIQPKLDGVRAIWKHKEKRFVSRRNKLLVVPQHIISSVSSAPFDLDGELLIKNLPLNKISGTVRLQDIFSERKNDLIYTVFDSFEQTTYDYRYNFIALNYKNIIDNYMVYDVSDIEKYHNINLGQGYEGSIIRNNTLYELKRSFNLLKLKPRQRIECKIIGMLEGTGKYEGMLGALIVQTSQGKIFNVGTGFTDEDRDCIWLREVNNYKNKLIIVEFRDYSEYGTPIEASFKGFKQ